MTSPAWKSITPGPQRASSYLYVRAGQLSASVRYRVALLIPRSVAIATLGSPAAAHCRASSAFLWSGRVCGLYICRPFRQGYALSLPLPDNRSLKLSE